MTGRALWPLRDEALAAAGSALMFALAFPPVPLIVPALICLVPAGVAITRASDRPDGIRAAARIGFWFGVLAYATGVYWIAPAFAHFTRLAVGGYLAIIVAAGMLTAIGAAGIAAVRRTTRWPMAIVLPLGWVALEVIFASLPEIAFPWLPLGLALAPNALVAQFADVSGVHGLSFVLAAVNGLIVDAWLARSWRPVLARASAAASLLIGLVAYGAWRMATTVIRPLGSVAVVQPNVQPREKWDVARQDSVVAALAGLTRAVPRSANVALIVWPEAALPATFEARPDWRDTLRVLVRDAGAPILLGMPEVERSEVVTYYNSAMLTSARGDIVQPAHRKRDLVPVIERVPFSSLPWLGASGISGGYSPGRLSVFDHPLGRIGTLICYESIFAGRARESRRSGAALLVSITNDAWFGRSTAPGQHASHLVLRAIETRAGIVRSANSGFSGYVDPLGRVHGRSALFVRAVGVHEVGTTGITTPYVRAGDWIGALSLVLTAAGSVVAAMRARARAARGRARRPAAAIMATASAESR